MPDGDLLSRIDDRDVDVVVLGQGYVGLPLAIRAAEVGFRVRGFDVDAARVADLRAGRSYVESVDDSEVAGALARGYAPTCDTRDLEGFDVAVISVPTPLHGGVPDLSHIEAAARALADVIRPDSLVILESTTYPGTTTDLLVPILEASGLVAGTQVLVGYSPERIDPGNESWNLVNTPKVVSGIDGRSLDAVEAFYRTLVTKTVRVSSTAEAELVKLLENTFRHVNIALVNEFAIFARALGIDIWDAIDAAATKPFGFMRFLPGPGVGGHCLPIDPSYFSWEVKRRVGQTFRFVELANDVNQHMPDHVVWRVTKLLNGAGRAVNGSRILGLGLAYKARSGDTREAPAITVLEQLRRLGADVSTCDPHVGGDVGFSPATLAAADLVVVLVDHPEFDPAVIAQHAPLVFDAKGVMRGHRFRGELL